MATQPTTSDIKAKALSLIARGQETNKDNQPLINRLDRAAGLIGNDAAPLIRIGYDSRNMRYLVPSRLHPATDWSKETATGNPFYTVILTDITGPGHHHVCECEDYQQAERWTRRIKSARGENKAAPVKNGRIYCKHILAAFAIQHARELFGLTWDIEKTAWHLAARKAEQRTETNRHARAAAADAIPVLERKAADAKQDAAHEAPKDLFGKEAQRYYIEHPDEFEAALAAA